MYDHSYNLVTFSMLLRKGDFRSIPAHARDAFREETLKNAIKSALTEFNGKNPIFRFHLKKKYAYQIKLLEDDLVIRKLGLNIKKITKQTPTNRHSLITNLKHFLEEGVPYRVYRLDISSFYESFKPDEIMAKAQSLRKLSPLSKRHLEVLLNFYMELEGKGLPRGMALSAIVSDFMMSDFDRAILAHPAVYFYGRFVDDIIIITNLSEGEQAFIEHAKQNLPKGLHLNNSKESVETVPNKPARIKPPASKPVRKFYIDYLGYRFSVFDPLKADTKTKEGYRQVRIEIAPAKISRIKLRILRSLLDYGRTKDLSLLIDRIKYLTSNFSVIDKNTGKRRMAGIYYGYPLLNEDSKSLKYLDGFLRSAILSKEGRVCSSISGGLTSSLKRAILAHSFKLGHKERRFVYFSSKRISAIQRCWIND
jgi:hypothetical protein